MTIHFSICLKSMKQFVWFKSGFTGYVRQVTLLWKIAEGEWRQWRMIVKDDRERYRDLWETDPACSLAASSVKKPCIIQSRPIFEQIINRPQGYIWGTKPQGFMLDSEFWTFKKTTMFIYTLLMCEDNTNQIHSTQVYYFPQELYLLISF